MSTTEDAFAIVHSSQSKQLKTLKFLFKNWTKIKSIPGIKEKNWLKKAERKKNFQEERKYFLRKKPLGHF